MIDERKRRDGRCEGEGRAPPPSGGVGVKCGASGEGKGKVGLKDIVGCSFGDYGHVVAGRVFCTEKCYIYHTTSDILSLVSCSFLPYSPG